jgi:STE24 endopeptidase
MLNILIIIFTLYTLLKVYISVMQIGYISDKKKEDAIILTPAKYQVAANYAIKKERLAITEALIDYFSFLFWVYWGFSWLQKTVGIDNELTSSVIFLLGFFAINFIFSLPLEIYKTFKLDKTFGFSTITPKMFIIDKIKSAILFLIIGGVLFYAIGYIIENFRSWWFYSFLVIFVFIVLINMLYPTLIAPIFNKFKPIEDKELKDEIEKILQNLGLKSDGIFSIDASKRDNRLNAYFAGFSKAKRVVLFDTLLKKLNKDEIIAVLGHELGHFTNKDVFKNIALMGLFLFIVFFIAGNIPNSLFIELGLTPNAGAKIAVIALILPIFSFIYMPIMGLISRHNEFEADKFGAKIGGKNYLIRALLKLVSENKSFPHSHPLYIFFYYTHPPIIERLKALNYDFSSKEEESILLGFLNENK